MKFWLKQFTHTHTHTHTTEIFSVEGHNFDKTLKGKLEVIDSQCIDVAQWFCVNCVCLVSFDWFRSVDVNGAVLIFRFLLSHQIHHGVGRMVRYPLPPGHQTCKKKTSIRHGDSPANDIWWWSMDICSNLFTWWPAREWHLVVADSTHPTGMLSCF